MCHKSNMGWSAGTWPSFTCNAASVEGGPHKGYCARGQRLCATCRTWVGVQARGDPQWWRMREAVLLAAAEVQEVLADLSGGAAFQTSMLLNMVLAQASSLPPWLMSVTGCHERRQSCRSKVGSCDRECMHIMPCNCNPRGVSPRGGRTANPCMYASEFRS